MGGEIPKLKSLKCRSCASDCSFSQQNHARHGIELSRPTNEQLMPCLASFLTPCMLSQAIVQRLQQIISAWLLMLCLTSKVVPKLDSAITCTTKGFSSIHYCK